MAGVRVGVDMGGAKIAHGVFDAGGHMLDQGRARTPRDYAATLAALADIGRRARRRFGSLDGMGVSLPGLVTDAGELVAVVNLPWVQGRPLRAELEAALGAPARLANDANCFVLSEAVDGAAAGAPIVFGATLGTGVGGGVAVHGRALAGPSAVTGEWGHNPMPWPDAALDGPPARCGCGRLGCIETYLQGAALSRGYERLGGGGGVDAARVAALAQQGDERAVRAIAGYADRLARALATVVNLLDPHVIVLGGGLSQIAELYRLTPERLRAYTVANAPRARLAPARHGADSGVRGAARLIDAC